MNSDSPVLSLALSPINPKKGRYGREIMIKAREKEKI